jgi:hypothetical protein
MPLENAADVHEGELILHGEGNERGGWLIGVYRQKYSAGAENLLSIAGRPGAGMAKLDIDAMNSPEFEGYRNPLVLRIRSTRRSLCMRWMNVRVYGRGAAASFRPGSSVEFRLLRNPD